MVSKDILPVLIKNVQPARTKKLLPATNSRKEIWDGKNQYKFNLTGVQTELDLIVKKNLQFSD